MKNFKKIMALSLVFLMMSVLPIFALSGSAYVSGPGSVNVGQSITVSVTVNADVDASFDLVVSASGAASGSTNWAPGSRGESRSFTFPTHAAGTATISVSGEGADWVNFNTFSVSGGTSVNVVNPNTGGGNTGGGNTGGGNTGGGNTGGGNTGGGNTGGGNTGGSSNNGGSSIPDEDKTPEQLAEEKAAEEAKAKEDAQKNPLISSFNIISNNEKKFGETLSDIPTAVDTWEYEYKLPKRIDSVLLDVKSVSETTTLTFDKEQKFAEGEKTKEVVIRAVDGEITQEYKLKLTLDDSEPVKVNVGDKTATLYDDEALDKLMTEYGFTREVIDQNGTASFAYQKDAMKLQLLTDEKQNAQWLALDKTNAAKTVVYPVLQDEGKMYILTAPNPEMAKQTYGGVAVTPTDLDFKKFEGVDSSLKFEKQVSVWNLEGESGMIVNGMQTTDSEPRLYHIDNTQKLTPAFVAFDVASSKTTKVWAITATVVAVALAAGFGAYLYVNRAPKKRKDVNI
ncbi:hypothetical protein [Erysipelothrix anatis]|uniref:hypothetical protein n=1 Tax=Erysipelothrix anatis TaxID=2683713 RepID=UPI0013589C8D|nr:hypothetical protein [Erysipelothrix anatis]